MEEQEYIAACRDLIYATKDSAMNQTLAEFEAQHAIAFGVYPKHGRGALITEVFTEAEVATQCTFRFCRCRTSERNTRSS